MITNSNLDLLSVGVAIAAIGLLGFMVYINNRNSLTNKSFFLLCIVTMIWGVSNYLEYRFSTITATLWALRSHVFLSTWHALLFFQFSYVFPDEKINFPKWYKFGILPIVLITSILALTQFVFPGISHLAPPGEVTDPDRGPGLILFSIIAFGLLIASIVVLLLKVRRAHGIVKRQTNSIFAGMLLMALLILGFNVFLPVAVHDVTYIPYAALFIFPFVAFTSYTIYKHKLFNIKVAAVGVVAFVLTVFSLVNVIYASSFGQIVINVIFFSAILIGSFILIQSILREVSQREHIEKLAADLQKANDRLRELDRQKSEFVSFATHQLRAPLTAIEGYASLLLEGDMGKLTKESSEGVSRIFESAKTMVSTVNDYLNVSRIELGTMKYDFETLDLKKLVEDTIGELKPNIEKSKLNFTFSAEPGDYKIKADRDKLKQVIANLVDNSMKYTPKGWVKVTLSHDIPRNKLVFTVHDNGVGIAPEVIPKLFQKFSRADGSSKINIKGTGLGLFVAKQMVEAHHGTIRAESEGEGKGSTFTVELDNSHLS